MDNRREQILGIVERELIGPDPVDVPGMIQLNGEEVLTSDSPLSRYIAGILYPHDSMEETILEEAIELNSIDDDVDEIVLERQYESEQTSDPMEFLEEAEELINRSNAYLPSAMSFTAAIRKGDVIKMKVEAGIYKKATVLVEYNDKYPGGQIIELITSSAEARELVTGLKKYTSKPDDDRLNTSMETNKQKEDGPVSGEFGEPKEVEEDEDERKKHPKTYYFRKKIEWDNHGKPLELPDSHTGVSSISEENGLRVTATYRYKAGDLSVYTFTLENTKKSQKESVRDEDCYFQTKMTVYSKFGFQPLPENRRINLSDEDYWSNQLLYRNIKTYAIGHGCATDWEQDSDLVSWISTATFPEYDMKPIVPSVIPGVSLDMLSMSKENNIADIIEELRLMCKKYSVWIDKLRVESKHMTGKLSETAERHINSCIQCHSRMINGIDLLEKNDKVRTAFLLMNKAMLLQQLRYNLPLQKWAFNGNQIDLENPITKLPILDDQSTWYNSENRVYGKWRPFQLAFILMNLESMYNPESSERSIVDLIWFPTGGGKTEAYLGLSAYTIFLRRLNDKESTGTSILMRYTLRLLTAQQYERASSMICACDLIRKENTALLGEERITIGLWVGQATSPNKMDDAVKKFENLMLGKGTNPFVMLKCPWCGAQMGIIENKNGNRYLPGYVKKVGDRGKREIVFQCYNSKHGCDFSEDNFPLPMTVIDEAIYDNPPTLLLGTVDKFARLPFEPRSQRLFGIHNGIKYTSPDLIIQDELHLISGPLGSMVGHYETIIQELCSYDLNGRKIYPKIIASTATISRAKEQCNALYACGNGNVFQFPPVGLDAGDSFFAEEDRSLNGRRYIGIMALSRTSDTTTAIRLYSALLYAAKAIQVNSEEERDPYWTNIGYFNSLRELGLAATWIKADIEQNLDSIYKRRIEHKTNEWEEYRKSRRYIYRDEELTSRISSHLVTESLANLHISYPQKNDKSSGMWVNPIDICLATNMISVGLDVPRLGLMTVSGQPKTTSEYIQATSRVGRDGKNAPGMVFVLYRPGRPRDKSHYEHFRSYHSRIYSNVEPTSVTPFSPRVRDRALHAVIVSITRLMNDNKFNQDKPPLPDNQFVDYAKKIIKERVEAIVPEELDDTLNHIDDILESWEISNPEIWSAQYKRGGALSEVRPLIYPSGQEPNDNWKGYGLATPNSMRNVDASCEAGVLTTKYRKRG